QAARLAAACLVQRARVRFAAVMQSPERTSMKTPTTEVGEALPPKDFLVKDYELKTGYLTQHFGRMWTRFNYFVGIESRSCWRTAYLRQRKAVDRSGDRRRCRLVDLVRHGRGRSLLGARLSRACQGRRRSPCQGGMGCRCSRPLSARRRNR